MTAPATIAARLWPLLAPAALVAAVALVLGRAGGDELERVVITGLINLTLVVSIYIFVGNSGVLSFGHLAFAAIGAYTGALLTIPPEQKPFLLISIYGFLADVHAAAVPATLAAGTLAAAFAALLAVPLMRLAGLAAALATFAVLVIVNVVASNWQAVTNGASGVSGVPTTTGLGTALIWALVAMAAAYAFQRSRWGRRLRASREDAIAASALGIGIHGERRLAFVISAFFAGIGGALLAQYLGSFTPGDFYVGGTFILLAMLVVGGMNSLSGAVLGTLLVSATAELLRRAEEGVTLGPAHFAGRAGLRDAGLALIMLGVLLSRPDGVTGNREWRLPSWLGRGSP